MSTFSLPSQRLKVETTVVPLTAVQQALWQLGMPILDAGAVANYKQRAKRGMLFRAVCWQLLGMVALVGLISIGRQWGRVAVVAGAAVALGSLFTWLVNACEFQWLSLDYGTYRGLHPVPQHVSAAVDALSSCGVAEQIRVEFLKSDPILFVEDPEDGSGVRRYDLIIWD